LDSNFHDYSTSNLNTNVETLLYLYFVGFNTTLSFLIHFNPKHIQLQKANIQPNQPVKHFSLAILIPVASDISQVDQAVLADVVTRVLVWLSQVINSPPQFAIPIHRFLSVNETAHLNYLHHVPQVTIGAPLPLHSLYGCMAWTGTALSLSVLPTYRRWARIAVGIVTCYRLDGLGIKSWLGQNILYPSRPALRPT